MNCKEIGCEDWSWMELA